MAEYCPSHTTINISKDRFESVYAAPTEDEKRKLLLQVVAAEVASCGFGSDRFNIVEMRQEMHYFHFDIVWPEGSDCRPTTMDIIKAGDIPPDMDGFQIEFFENQE